MHVKIFCYFARSEKIDTVNLFHFWSVTVTVTKLWHRFSRSLRYLITILVINLDRLKLILSVKNIKTQFLFWLELEKRCQSLVMKIKKKISNLINNAWSWLILLDLSWYAYLDQSCLIFKRLILLYLAWSCLILLNLE
jgi:hypothetical protein